MPGQSAAQAYYPQPQQSPYTPQFGAPAPVAGGEWRFQYTGTGGELFKEMFVGALFVMLTLGIYVPWFKCRMDRYIASKTTLTGTPRGTAQVEYNGTGGGLLGTMLVGVLLTSVTLGIYLPWFICNMIRFNTEHTSLIAQDGTRYTFKFNGTGGALWVQFLVGELLSMITLGIYAPWFMCKLQKFVFSNVQILENGQPVGQVDFVGEGGALFGTFLVNYLLMMITLGLYAAWFNVNMRKFFAQNTRITIHGRTFVGDFQGSGGDYFGILLVSGLLSTFTLGIYAFWGVTNMIRFDHNNRTLREVGGGGFISQAAPYG